MKSQYFKRARSSELGHPKVWFRFNFIVPDAAGRVRKAEAEARAEEILLRDEGFVAVFGLAFCQRNNR
jgi:hypothetical protein